ncbi:hypothetical protein AVEN_218654-1 [Araneus ventricosus]|uniref:Uncharacterized protein n=1 Tax=Araneus ventricosus TaxID=182803 RepID=A0A4Y2B4I5_ARAVE|nr:hypothetical protein AVEN_218654-1 [Araneus ventricosus]
MHVDGLTDLHVTNLVQNLMEIYNFCVKTEDLISSEKLVAFLSRVRRQTDIIPGMVSFGLKREDVSSKRRDRIFRENKKKIPKLAFHYKSRKYASEIS